jgi:hypothetical protein
MSRFNPPTLPVTTNILRVTVQSTVQGQIFNFLFDYVSTTLISLTPAAIVSFLNNWSTAFMADLRACLSSSQTIQNLTGADLNPGTTPTQFTVENLAGTAAATTLPIFVSAIITKQSSIKGQHGRGRNYIGSVPTTFTDPGTEPDLLNATALSAYRALNTALLGTPVTAGGTNWTWCITTRPVAPSHLVTHYAPVATVAIDNFLGTTRRRKEGRGI